MIVNRSFDEYVQNPLTAPEVLIIRRRIRLQSYVGIVFVLVFGLAFGGIAGAVHDDIVWAVPVALMAMLGGVTLWMNISDRVCGRLNVQAEFQIDDRWLMGGNDFSAFNYIDEHIDEVMDRYKAPDSMRILFAVADRQRPLIRAETILLDQIEDAYKEALYLAA